MLQVINHPTAIIDLGGFVLGVWSVVMGFFNKGNTKSMRLPKTRQLAVAHPPHPRSDLLLTGPWRADASIRSGKAHAVSAREHGEHVISVWEQLGGVWGHADTGGTTDKWRRRLGSPCERRRGGRQVLNKPALLRAGVRFCKKLPRRYQKIFLN